MNRKPRLRRRNRSEIARHSIEPQTGLIFTPLPCVSRTHCDPVREWQRRSDVIGSPRRSLIERRHVRTELTRSSAQFNRSHEQWRLTRRPGANYQSE